MEKNKEKHHGGSLFFWGLLIGALLATLLTTKRGRLILREVLDLAVELIENMAEKQKKNKEQKNLIAIDEIRRATDDIKSEIAEDEKPDVVVEQTFKEESVFESSPDEVEAESSAETKKTESKDNDTVSKKTNGNGHDKKRLFRGIRKSK